MRKTVEINGIPVEFKSSAAVPRMYRIKFGKDIFTDMQRLEKDFKKQKEIKEAAKKEAEEKGEEFNEENFESTIPASSLEIFENVAFIMSKHADPSQPSDIYEWLDQFETFDIYKILPEILSLWIQDTNTRSKAKKEFGK